MIRYEDRPAPTQLQELQDNPKKPEDRTYTKMFLAINAALLLTAGMLLRPLTYKKTSFNMNKMEITDSAGNTMIGGHFHVSDAKNVNYDLKFFTNCNVPDPVDLENPQKVTFDDAEKTITLTEAKPSGFLGFGKKITTIHTNGDEIAQLKKAFAEHPQYYSHDRPDSTLSPEAKKELLKKSVNERVISVPLPKKTFDKMSWLESKLN